MREALLLKIALTASIVGILGLFFLAETVSVEETAISKIDGVQQEKPVQVTGIVKRVANKGNVTFLTVAKQEEISIILFAKGSRYYSNLTVGDTVAVVGKAEKYKDAMEIVAETVRKIDRRQ